jgi:hypothetical protein
MKRRLQNIPEHRELSLNLHEIVRFHPQPWRDSIHQWQPMTTLSSSSSSVSVSSFFILKTSKNPNQQHIIPSFQYQTSPRNHGLVGDLHFYRF